MNDGQRTINGEQNATNNGAPRAKPVVPWPTPRGATFRSYDGAFLHGQRPWSPAAGMNDQQRCTGKNGKGFLFRFRQNGQCMWRPSLSGRK
jgi:hypothetical protein